MTPVSHVSAAVGVGQRADERDGAALVAGAERGPSVTVNGGVGRGRAAVQHVDDVGLDVRQLVSSEHSGEDVEAAARVRLGDLGMQLTVVGEADRPAIAEVHGSLGAGCPVGDHLVLDIAVADDGHLGQPQHCRTCAHVTPPHKGQGHVVVPPPSESFNHGPWASYRGAAESSTGAGGLN